MKHITTVNLTLAFVETKSEGLGQVWWCVPLIPVLRKQRQEDLCKFNASLSYRVSSRSDCGPE